MQHNSRGQFVRMRVLLAISVVYYRSVVLSCSSIGLYLFHRSLLHVGSTISINVSLRDFLPIYIFLACCCRNLTMSGNKTKKVKMATKSCPECDQQVRECAFSLLTAVTDV